MAGKNQESDDTFKILIATDCHLGYGQTKSRGHELDDSFIAFEEILQYAQKHDVDFILLGGDLFHDTKPSQITLTKCMNLLRKYCMGTRKHKMQFLSDPELIFGHCTNKTVNYEDPNFNISIPVFSIHGNHDDPSFGAIGSMDVMCVTGLLNYFGKWTDLTQISIPPIVLKKGLSHLALYGLSYINDQRLSRLFRDQKVKFLRPNDIEGEPFNIFVLHQNRAQHTANGYIPEGSLPKFLDFVIWGHEHECLVEPKRIMETGYFICQPGSSVATSLCQGEAVPKHVALLKVNQQSFTLKKLKLNTVRPFVFDDLILSDHQIEINYSENYANGVRDFVDHYIEHTIIPRVCEQITNHPQQPQQPLIRLRVFYKSSEEIFDPLQLSQRYCDTVANPTDMIVFRKQVERGKKAKAREEELDDLEDFYVDTENEPSWTRSVQGLIKEYYMAEENRDKLKILSVNGLTHALHRFIENDDHDVFPELIKHQKGKIMDYLNNKDGLDPENIEEDIKAFRDERFLREKAELEEVRTALNKPSKKKSAKQSGKNDGTDDGEEDADYPPAKNTQANRRARGTRGTRGARGRGSRGGRGGKQNLLSTVTIDD